MKFVDFFVLIGRRPPRSTRPQTLVPSTTPFRSRHARIVAGRLLRRERKAFGKVARADAGGVEGLDAAEHRLDLGQRRAEPVGDIEQRGGEIAGLVDLVDQNRKSTRLNSSP